MRFLKKAWMIDPCCFRQLIGEGLTCIALRKYTQTKTARI